MSIAVSVARSGFACWLQGPEIHGTFTDGRSFQTYSPSDPSLIQRLYNKGVSITARPQSDNLSWFVSPLISRLPFVALIGVCIFLSRQMQGIAKLLTEAHGRDERQNPICQEIDLPRTLRTCWHRQKATLLRLSPGVFFSGLTTPTQLVLGSKETSSCTRPS